MRYNIKIDAKKELQITCVIYTIYLVIYNLYTIIYTHYIIY